MNIVNYIYTACGNAYTWVNDCVRPLDKEIRAAASIAFTGIKIAFAAWVNPNLFTAAVFVGLIWPSFVKEKLDGIYKSCTSDISAFSGLATLLVVLKLPVVILTYSVWTGTRLGSSLRGDADEMRQTAAANVTG